jgi:uncharacterized protein (TIGR02391 family)
MDSPFDAFARIVRRAYRFTEERSLPAGGLHPFDERNIHPQVAVVAKKLFDDGHYAQATFEVYKFVDTHVQRLSVTKKKGRDLMMAVFSGTSPLIQLTPLSTESEENEQEGYKFLFAGSIIAIRNPRAHECGVVDSPDLCLDHLGLASMLLRRLEAAGYK